MQEIQLYSNLPAQLDAIDRLGDTFAKSGMFKCTRIEQGRTIVVMCMTMGITPTEFLAKYDLIDGAPRKKALACLADFRRAGGRHKWLTASDDMKKATGEFTYEGQTYTVTFTIEDAQRQGLSFKPGSNWVKTPSNMLRARVITTAIGMLAPEIVAGGDDEPSESGISTVPLNLGGGPTIDVPNAVIPESAKVPALPPPSTSPPPSPPPPRKPSRLPPPPEAPRVTTTPEEEAELAGMGLAPEKKAEPDYPQAKGVTLSFKKKTPPPVIEPDADEEPIPPAGTIEPETVPAKGAVKHNPLVPPDQLDVETVEAMGHIFQGHFVEVANWMIKNSWIQPAEHEIKTEAQAAAHLQATLPLLTKGRAKRILTKKLAFMRAIEEIAP